MDYKQVIDVLQGMVAEADGDRFIALRTAIDAVIQVKAFEDAEQDRWIPIKCHKITDEEREENEYPKDLVWFLDCEMPADGQKIFVQTTWGSIDTDWCYIEDGFSLDSGWDWVADIVAWMPLPTLYKGGE